MPYIGVMTRTGTCAICDKSLPKGTSVYHDSTKNQGKHLAHIECWDKLRAGRPKPKPEKKPMLSTEPLDPPF